MSDLNKCTFIGRLGADPEVRSLNSGDRVCNLRLAVSESWKDRTSGERKEKVEWVRVVIFNEHLVKIAEQYLVKGAQIYIEGKMQTRKFQNSQGQDQYSTEIVLPKFGGEIIMLGKPAGNSESRDDRGGGGYGGGEYRQDQRGNPQRESFSADLDDEIPFLSGDSIW